MIGHLEDLLEIWETLDTCYERPEKYMAEVLKPILEFRKYKMCDNAAMREFYSLLRASVLYRHSTLQYSAIHISKIMESSRQLCCLLVCHLSFPYYAVLTSTLLPSCCL